MSKEITICNTHDTPLIWTFAFPYTEWFCMAGNHAGGMLGTGHTTELTPELKRLESLYNRRWGQLRKHIVVGQFRRRDCVKCEVEGDYHNYHLTPAERRRSEMALKKLVEYAS